MAGRGNGSSDDVWEDAEHLMGQLKRFKVEVGGASKGLPAVQQRPRGHSQSCLSPLQVDDSTRRHVDKIRSAIHKTQGRGQPNEQLKTVLQMVSFPPMDEAACLPPPPLPVMSFPESIPSPSFLALSPI